MEALPELSRAELAKLVKLNNKTFVEATRHLGGMCSRARSSMHEISKRLRAMQSAWNTMCGWWFSSNEKQLRRMVFRCIIIGTAISGLITYVLLPSEFKKLSTFILRKLRGMMQGKATSDGPEHKVAKNNKEIWEWWNLVPLEVELRIARIR